LGRLGGEEFGLLLVHTPLEDAIYLAERLRCLIEQDMIPLDVDSVSITISIGVTALSQKTGNLDTLLKQADQALYQAKDTGRNRVMTWHEG